MFAALNPIALQLGGLEIHWYGVIIACGVLLAVWLAMKESVRRGISDDHILNLVLWALPFALIGARTYYVALNGLIMRNIQARSLPFGMVASRFMGR
jgi:phosphatidylglycerol:prolipoprotein diacylglycerol transferase